MCPIDVNNLFICIWYSCRVATIPLVSPPNTFKQSAAGIKFLFSACYFDPPPINITTPFEFTAFAFPSLPIHLILIRLLEFSKNLVSFFGDNKWEVGWLVEWWDRYYQRELSCEHTNNHFYFSLDPTTKRGREKKFNIKK